MIVKQQFTPQRIVPYIRGYLAVGTAAGVAAWALVDRAGVDELALPGTLSLVLGPALSILLALRVSTAYQRWWEASGALAQMVGASRNLVRNVVAIGDAKIVAGADVDLVHAFQRDVIDTQVAWSRALGRHLRGTGGAPDGPGTDVDNPPLALLARQSARIQAAYAEGVLAGLDNFQMEAALTTIGTQQAVAERIKAQPVPRQFDVFGRYFTVLFVGLFPFTLVGSLGTTAWLTISAGIVVAAVFGVVERSAAVTEGPFENRIQDVPLTAIATQLERDLRQLAGATAGLPAPPAPENGYLW